MDKSLVRFLLEGWMPGDPSEQDPQVRAALAQARADPELSTWLDRKIRADSHIVAQVARHAPPPELRATILAGMAASRRRPPRVSYFKPLAWAASFALLATLAGAGWLRLGNPSELRGHGVAALADETLRYSRRGPRLAFTSASTSELQSWLAKLGIQLPERLPAEVAGLPAIGCRVLEFQGRSIALLCFQGDRTYHLYIAPGDMFRDYPFAERPVFVAREDWGAATWSEGEFVYLLNGAGAPDEFAIRSRISRT